MPEMIERFVEGMTRNPDLSALTCCLKAFNHEEGIDAEVSEYVYMPTGGPFVLACFENVYGDTNAIFRTQDFRDAGGFETDPNTFMEDWETFVRLVASGLKIDVIPEALVYYRLRGDNRSLAMSRERTDTYPFVQRMIKRRFVPHKEMSEWDADMLWLGMASFGIRKPAPPPPPPPPALAIEPVPHFPLRYRVADKLNSYLKWITPFHWICRRMVAVAVSASSRDRPPTVAEPGEDKITSPHHEAQAPRRIRWPRRRTASVNKAA